MGPSARSPWLAVLPALWLAACGEASTPDTTERGEYPVVRPALETVVGRPAPAQQQPEVATQRVRGHVVDVAARGSAVVLGTTVGALRRTPAAGGSDRWQAMRVWSGDGPAGRIAAAVGWGDTVLVAASGGFFFAEGGWLVRSPADPLLSDLPVAELRTEGVAGLAGSDQLWVAADGTYHLALTGEGGDSRYEVRRLQVRRELGGPSALLPGDDGTLHVAYGPRLYELDRQGDGGERYELPFGWISRIERAPGGALAFATERGLFVRAADGGFTRYTLTDDDVGAAVHDLTLDATRGLLAVTADAVLLLEDQGAPLLLAPLPASDLPRSAALDPVGKLWVGGGDSVSSLTVSRPPGFAADIAPLLVPHCDGCHGLGEDGEVRVLGATPYDFADYDTVVDDLDAVILQIQLGRMPPGGGFPAGGLELLVRWADGGRAP